MDYRRMYSMEFKQDGRGIAWFKPGIWKLRGMRKGLEKGG
jgi:hypothetical protein